MAEFRSRRLARLIQAFCAGVGLLLIASTASAVAVKDGSVFKFADTFENTAAGSEPLSPQVGSWLGTTSSSTVQNGPVPGAYEGTKYLRLIRPNSVTIAADFGAVSSGTVSAYFSLFIPTGSNNFVFEMSLSPTLDLASGGVFVAPVFVESFGTSVNTYVAPGGDASYTGTGVSLIPGQWQSWRVDYTFLAGANNDTFTVTVDGNTSAPINGGGYNNVADPASLRYLEFRTGGTGNFFLDTSPAVPEPASAALAVMLAGCVVARRRR